MIEFKNVTYKRKQKTILEGINFVIEAEDVVALIGPNGSGKTTIMKLILGLIIPSKGEILIKGKPLSPKNRRFLVNRFGALIESPSFYGFLTVLQNLELHGRLYNAERAEIKQIIEVLGLSQYGDQKADKLSFGFKQRLGLALAMVGNTELLLLDEPFNGLDFKISEDLKSILSLLIKEMKMTMLISTHETHHLEPLVNKVIYFDDSKVISKVIGANTTLETIKKTILA
jgi:ABC-2 type transport system ATP-binding protein